MTKQRYILEDGLLLIEKDDDRYDEFIKHKKETGISPDEAWSLDYSIAIFILPRLRLFKENKAGYPGCFNSIEEWDEVLDNMINAFNIIVTEDCCFFGEDETTVEKGLNDFRDYFLSLWS